MQPPCLVDGREPALEQELLERRDAQVADVAVSPVRPYDELAHVETFALPVAVRGRAGQRSTDRLPALEIGYPASVARESRTCANPLASYGLSSPLSSPLVNVTDYQARW